MTTPKYGFQNGRGTATPPGPIATGTNPTDPTSGSTGGIAANSTGAGTGAVAGVTSGTGATSPVLGTTGTSSASTTPMGTSALTSTGSESTYVVKKGDTFETISKSVYGSSSKWKEIAKANPTVDPTRMKIGAKLRIPAAGASVSSENALASATPKSTTSTGSTSANGSKSTVAGATSSGTHVVAKGETFSSIARTYYGDSKFWKAIAKANPKVSEKSLSVGTKIAIPPKSAVVAGGNIER